MMRLSDAGLAAIKGHEGLRLDAYPDPGSSNGLPVTIGYGSTKTLTGKPWKIGDRISEAEAEALLIRDVEDFETAVNRLVTVPLTQGQFDALVSLAFNIGVGAFEKSTLLRLLNMGDYEGASDQFLRWIFNDGVRMRGLENRRDSERAMFRSGIRATGAPIAAPDVPAPAPEPIAAPEPILRPDGEPSAPIVESQPVFVQEKPMNPFLGIAVSELVKRIPELIRTFGNGEVTERNAKAAEALVGAVTAATGARTAQEAIEVLDNDPVALQTTREVLERDAWFEPTEAAGGVEAARQFSVEVAESGIPFWQLPVGVVTIMMMLLVFAVVGTVLWMPGWSSEIRVQVVTAVLQVLGLVGAFWLGMKVAPRSPS